MRVFLVCSQRVLGMTESITDMGSIRWELFVLLIIAWIVVYFCIFKSVKATGKVVYVTATVPVLLLITFLIREIDYEAFRLDNYYIKSTFVIQ